MSVRYIFCKGGWYLGACPFLGESMNKGTIFTSDSQCTAQWPGVWIKKDKDEHKLSRRRAGASVSVTWQGGLSVLETALLQTLFLHSFLHNLSGLAVEPHKQSITGWWSIFSDGGQSAHKAVVVYSSSNTKLDTCTVSCVVTLCQMAAQLR